MKPWHDGWLTLVAACALTASIYALDSWWPILGLLVLWAVTPTSRKAATNDGEAEQPTTEQHGS